MYNEMLHNLINYLLLFSYILHNCTVFRLNNVHINIYLLFYIYYEYK